MIKELDPVALTHDLAEHGLLAGDIGTVVHVYETGAGFEVEFVRGSGETVAVATLTSADIRPLGAAEILHARKLAS
ncbi:MAG: DUF4926 domain-containing protein [Longimicrobiales bacterium]